MIANTLIHREFTSSYTAKFVIEKDRMYTENANRSSGDGIITPDNMEPNPKNPIIASFKELALKMNVLLSTVNRLLVRLQEENIIVREGNNRKGRWVIKNDNEQEHHKTNY